MISARETAAEIGGRMLNAAQRRRASLGNVLTMFSATGISESERLEMAMMLQRFILEGYLKGVDAPRMLERRASREGLLHVGFSDDAFVPHRNTLQFDRATWRTQPLSTRMTDLVGKLGARMSARYGESPAPRRNSAPRHAEPPRTGPLRKSFTPQAVERVAREIQAVVAPSRIGQVFDGLREFSRVEGIRPPQMMREHAPIGMSMGETPVTAAQRHMQSQQTFETRTDMVNRGLSPMKIQNMMPRQGIASARPLESVNPAEMAAAGGRPNRIVLYTGPGTWGTEIQEIKENAAALGIQVDTKSDLNGVNWGDYAGVVFPGGLASTQYSSLSQAEISSLKSAIQGGLNYLGHCAGAFLAGTWSYGLGILPGVPGETPTDIIGRTERINFGNFGSRTTTFYGGPTNLSVYGGKTLATYSDGAASMISRDYGQGKVIVTSGHPSVERGNDSESDDDIHKALLQALVSGTDPGMAPPPGGNPPPPGGGPPPPGTPPGAPVEPVNREENVYNIAPPQVTPFAGMNMGGSGGARGGGAGHRKTPVAGMLPENFVPSTFAASLQSMIGRATPMLQQLGGLITRFK